MDGGGVSGLGNYNLHITKKELTKQLSLHLQNKETPVYLVLFFFRLSPDDHLSHHVINSALQTSNNYKWCQTLFQETFYKAM